MRPPGDSDDQAILIWTEVQPLFRAPPRHERSVWGRVRGSPDTILLITTWKSTLNITEFIASRLAQIYRENFESGGMIHMSSCEAFSRYGFRIYRLPHLLRSYVQLFWVYFLTPLTQAYKAQIFKLTCICTGSQPYLP
ncbi:Dimeric alpha-beta barrel [Penicillium vulpinum]|uniref:Dimeric alpha-beta barrel n=1 Tax=Penicillium vulpinum TaxID=29845 RepID=UPI00254990F3|nr:Dimeric alpha-beta barrel [Penicillium vulpinum]KAJ5964744.1 Dimeric alpha-beta barrel [Penicillium vulpinum]